MRAASLVLFCVLALTALKSTAWAASTVASKLGPKMTIPAAPPPPAVIPPPDLAPPHPTAPPPPPPVHPDAPGQMLPIKLGARLTYGDGRADFNRASADAIVALAKPGLTDPSVVYDLYAHAAGTQADLSTPRRLALERALGVRSALIHAGIPSVRIYVHAVGAGGIKSDAPADRVDIVPAHLDTTPPPGAPKAP